MKKIIITSIALVSGLVSLAQHETHLTQNTLHKAFLNPASIVQHPGSSGALFHKSQWVGFSGAPVFQGINYNFSLPGADHATGFTLKYDKIGVNKTLDFTANYAYNLKLSEGKNLAFALSPTLRFKQSNFGEVATNDFDPLYQASTPMTVMPNFAFGTFFHTSKHYAGITIPNLLKNQLVYDGELRPTTSFDMTDMHLYIHGGTKLEVTRDLDMEPSLIIKHVAGTPLQFDINLMGYLMDKVGFGLGYRSSREFSLMANYNINEKFTAGYAYDMNFSDLTIFTSGSHELMIVYKLRKMPRKDDKKEEGGGEVSIEL